MEQSTRLAHVAIMVRDKNSVGIVNGLLSTVADYVVGRMGLPYPKNHVNIISIVLDAPLDVINTLTGRLGNIPGVTAKAMFAPTST